MKQIVFMKRLQKQYQNSSIIDASGIETELHGIHIRQVIVTSSQLSGPYRVRKGIRLNGSWLSVGGKEEVVCDITSGTLSHHSEPDVLGLIELSGDWKAVPCLSSEETGAGVGNDVGGNPKAIITIDGGCESRSWIIDLTKQCANLECNDTSDIVWCNKARHHYKESIAIVFCIAACIGHANDTATA